MARPATTLHRPRVCAGQRHRACRRRSTTITTGSGSSQIEYNIDAPVAIDGGSGINTVTVLGSGFGDSFVITNQGVEGADSTSA